jgi:hypothetical protein
MSRGYKLRTIDKLHLWSNLIVIKFSGKVELHELSMPTWKSSGAHLDLRFEFSNSSWKIGDDMLPELPELSKISPSPLSLFLFLQKW